MMDQKKELVFHNAWNNKRHNNCRYSALLPRLHSVASRYFFVSDWSAAAYIQTKLFQKVLGPINLPKLANEYNGLYCTELAQITMFPGPVIVDIDDPDFQDADLINKLNNDRVMAVITTTDQLRSKMLSDGLRHPCYVIPSGVDFNRFDDKIIQRLESQYPRTDGNVRLAYAVPKFYLSKELAYPHRSLVGGKLRSIDWLLEVMNKVWQKDPNVELWLMGETTRLVRKVCERETRIHLLGYIPYNEIMPYYSLFDIALYPRTTDLQGRHSIKLLEYMASGLPIVSTSVSEAFRIREACAGIICSDQDEFVEAILKLANSTDLRIDLGEQGRQFAALFEWNIIAEKYNRILDMIIKPQA